MLFRSPIANFGKWLTDQKIASADELGDIADSVRADAEAAVAYALDAAYPDVSEVALHVFAENAA